MTTNDIKEKVLQEIRSGNVKMRPRAYFVGRLALIALASIFAFLVALFFLSFIMFRVHESHEFFLFGFGPRGFGSFALIFPWLMVTLIAVMLFVTELLLRRFKFGYRIPVIRAMALVLGAMFILGLLIQVTPLHHLFLDRAEHGNLPFIGDMYRDVHSSHHQQGVVRGIVISISTSTIVIQHDDHDRDTDDGTTTVRLPAYINPSAVAVGDYVLIAGDATNSEIQAFGVRKLPPR